MTREETGDSMSTPTDEDMAKAHEVSIAYGDGDEELFVLIAHALADTRKAERVRIAGALAALPASQAIADLVGVMGLSTELDAAWDDLHPGGKGL